MSDSTLTTTYVGEIHDANLSGPVLIPLADTIPESARLAVGIIDRVGVWQSIEGADGDILLSDSATIAVWHHTMPRDTIIDALRVIELSERGRPVIRRRGWDY